MSISEVSSMDTYRIRIREQNWGIRASYLYFSFTLYRLSSILKSIIKFVNIFQFNSMFSSVQIQPNNFDLAVKSDKNNKFDKVN